MQPSAFTLCFLFSPFLLSGCEGYRCADGVVRDRQSGALLDSVLCTVVSGNKVAYTDSTGAFDVCNNISGCVPDCMDIVVRFTKSGYKTREETNPAPDAVIYLEKE